MKVGYNVRGLYMKKSAEHMSSCCENDQKVVQRIFE